MIHGNDHEHEDEHTHRDDDGQLEAASAHLGPALLLLQLLETLLTIGLLAFTLGGSHEYGRLAVRVVVG